MRVVALAVAALLACGALSAGAADADPAPEAALAELAHRSGLSVDELRGTLADCQADQQSMYFCAWRDEIAGEQGLEQVLSEAKKAHPACAAVLDARVSAWKRQRDRVCKQAAQREWGAGSMEPTARLLCQSAETRRLVSQINARPGCER